MRPPPDVEEEEDLYPLDEDELGGSRREKRADLVSEDDDSDYDDDDYSLGGLASRSKKDKKSAMEKYTIPEITSESEWLHLTGQLPPNIHVKQAFHAVKPKQILVIDIYSSWSGPCSAMEGHLRRMRHQFVETPDCLALAKACCDDIDVLQPFKSDPRPTFLFWARGRSVALLRGANRPLLTRLVEQEVEYEANELPREGCDIDFASGRVIQCEGELAALDEDEVVHSIGSGCTEKLTTFFQEPQIIVKKRTPRKKSDELEPLPDVDPAKSPEENNNNNNKNENGEDVVDGEKVEDGEEKVGDKEEPTSEENGGDKEEKTEEGEEANKENGEAVANGEEEEAGSEEGSRKTPRSSINGEVSVNEGFGMKKQKKAKKMETGLLKEILDAKPGKRYGH